MLRASALLTLFHHAAARVATWRYVAFLPRISWLVGACVGWLAFLSLPVVGVLNARRIFFF